MSVGLYVQNVIIQVHPHPHFSANYRLWKGILILDQSFLQLSLIPEPRLPVWQVRWDTDVYNLWSMFMFIEMSPWFPCLLHSAVIMITQVVDLPHPGRIHKPTINPSDVCHLEALFNFLFPYFIMLQGCMSLQCKCMSDDQLLFD